MRNPDVHFANFLLSYTGIASAKLFSDSPKCLEGNQTAVLCTVERYRNGYLFDFFFREAALSAGVSSTLRLVEGTYVMVGGPQFETPAELRMLRTCGVDAVGEEC